MKKALILISILTLFINCNSNEKEEEEQIYGGVQVVTSLELMVKDNNGKNLLDPANQNSFDKDEIKIFYLIDGKKFEFYAEHLDYSKGFKVIQNELTLEYYINIHLYNDKNEDISTTYIQWNENYTDTIKALFYYPPNSSSVLLRKIWYNDELKWDFESDNHTMPFFELVK